MRRTFVGLVAASVTLAACGSGGDGSGSSSSAVRLTVLAAASLSKVLPEIGRAFTAANPGVTFEFEFAGTDALAAQLEQGSPGDVFAGASTKYGDQLSDDGLIRPWTAFATNRLVLAIPAANPGGIASLRDLTRSGLKLVIGAPTVPIGAYTRTVLANLDATFGSGYDAAVLANVVSQEDSVTSIMAKVQTGEADAGFVYVTDALAAGTAVTAIDLPDAAQAVATYPIAVVDASAKTAVAQRFVDFVLSPDAQSKLRAAGFGPPPGG
jgi:molybdate transport system substrate-binding protein